MELNQHDFIVVQSLCVYVWLPLSNVAFVNHLNSSIVGHVYTTYIHVYVMYPDHFY